MSTQRPSEALRIFINYRRDDTSGHAGRLYDALSGRFGEEHVFMDIDRMEPGLDFTEVINREVGSCDVLLALMGRQWLTTTDDKGTRRLTNPNDYVRIEIEAALNRDIRVIPVLVQDVEMPAEAVLPDTLRRLARRQAVELSDTRWNYDVGELVRALEHLGGQATPAAGGELDAPATPLRGAEVGQPAKRFAWLTPLRLVIGAGVVALAAVALGLGIFLTGDGGEARPEPGAAFSDPPALFVPPPAPRGDASASFAGDSLVLNVRSEPYPVLANEGGPEDVRLNVTAKKTSGPNDYGFSILCRARNSKEYYTLGIQSRGRATITKFANNKGRFLAPPKAFQPPADGRYTLQARCDGTDPVRLLLDVNDRPAAQAVDRNDPLTGSKVGLRASAGTGLRVKIRFDDFIRAPL